MVEFRLRSVKDINIRLFPDFILYPQSILVVIKMTDK